MSAPPLCRIDRLSVSFPGDRALVQAVRELTLAIPAGGRLALLGESGSGKSVTALALAGLLPIEAIVEGRIDWPALGRPPLAGRDLGYVFQDPMSSLDPVLTIGEQIGEVLVTHGRHGWREALADAVRLLQLVHLPEPERRIRGYAHELSGGQRQRVAIAMAIAAGPRLLIADEPTTALDMVVQAEIASLLAELSVGTGMGLLLISHDLALAANLATLGAVLYAGRLVEAGPMARLVTAPRHPYTQGLLAASLDLDRPLPDRLVEIPGSLPAPDQPLPGCPFAPRCAHARAACRERFPAWNGSIGDGVACVLHPPGTP